MEVWKLIAIPVIGFLIGYFTNYIAIKMLFYPRKKILGFQGVLPKRKMILAKNVGDVSVHVLPDKIKDLEKIPFVGEKIMDLIKESVERQVGELSDEKLEEIVMKVVKRELSFITWMGGLLGFIIGLVQVLIILI